MARQKSNDPVPLDNQVCYAIYSAGMAIQRLYKPWLDQLGLTYPQYLVLNVLWQEDEQTVGHIGEKLALESSTLTPLLKRLESAGLLRRTRNPDNERQVVISLTDQGLALRSRAGCLGDALLDSSSHTPNQLGSLNHQVRQLRDDIYAKLGSWAAPS